MEGYQNGFSPLEGVVTAFCEIEGTNPGKLNAEQLHDLAALLSAARHDRHGQPPQGRTRETVVIGRRDGTEAYREEVITSTPQGDK